MEMGVLTPSWLITTRGKLYPLAQRNDMIKQLPHLKKKYVYHRDYGDATMQDVFSPSELKKADVYTANTMATSWFENDNGKFSLHTLPMEAQVTPTTAILVTDMNNDDHEDLILVGNTSRSDVETGRYDAGRGVILLGDGQGNFEFVPNSETGFWVPGEATDIQYLTSGDKDLIVVLNNDDAVQVFRKTN